MMKVVAGLMNFDWKYVQGGLFVIYTTEEVEES